MLKRLSGFVTRRRRMVLVTAVVLIVIGGTAATTLFGKLSAGGFDDPTAESGQAADVLEDTFGRSQPNLTLLVTAPDGVDDPAAATEGEQLTRRLSEEEHVRNVVSYWSSAQAPQLRSDNGDKALIMATITGDDDAVDERVSELAPSYRGMSGPVRVEVGGYAMFQHELTEQSERDVVTGELIVFPVTLVALVFVFGGVVAALLPLAVALVTSMTAMGLLWLLAEITNLSVLSANVVTLAGLGLAIDYSLLIVNRYREELRAGQATGAAIRATMVSAGRTVVFAALTVSISLGSLTLFPIPAMRSIGYAGVVTALLAAAVSLTVLPALFAVLGQRVGRARMRRRTAEAGNAENGFWHRLATFVMRRPLPIATAVTAVLLLFGAPFLGIKLGYVDERVMPESSESRQVASTIRTDFASGEQDALQVVAEDADVGSDVLGAYATELSTLDHVARVDTATGSYAHGAQQAPAGPAHERFAAANTVYLSVVPESGTTEQDQRLALDIRATPAPFDTLVGGTAAVAEDADAALIERLPYGLTAVGVAMLVLLFLLTGSVVLPFLALVLSTLSLTATFGAMVWIFQEGNLSGLLGDFTVTGTTISTVPIMLFALAFGLAMDYQVFMLSRIREEYELRGEPTAAVAMGLERIGRIVTAAAVLISIVFLAFLISDLTYMKAFGVGLPLAVLIDATLIRGALLPATMRLGGRATWWAPAPLRRLHARFGLRESEQAPEPESVPAA
ncbi:RND superfamily putative drug exporter [Haloactinopolyspora alba]|uniref:RND superfamily putative drug exporter n=1 Tax=Haloactinopolyspora alba TaxID=648780 RepID=A0A2P8DJ61_9ACTN|nr:MMPL family transporter [Haloactinopolyspora alba]PSK97260.1 RND superfamily putative drug exporter [Haloactinopolyspora alba]